MHTIRLHGPWQCSCDGNGPHTIRVPLEGESLPAIPTGSTVLFQRRFQRPTGLEPGQGVWLRIEVGGDEHCDVRLNDLPLGRCDEGPGRWRIEQRLQATNMLMIEWVATERERFGLQSVALEIEGTSGSSGDG